MKYQQLVRIDKIYNEPIYLLSKNYSNNKYVFEICGSTKNIYNVKLYNLSKTIYCNCPDGKGYVKKNGLICKHSCFILLKVLKLSKLSNTDDFFNSLLFTPEQIIEINSKYNSLEFLENDFIKLDYINKFKNKNNTNNEIIIKENYENICPICYDELLDITNKKFNHQCVCCHKIFHLNCLNKWLNLGKSNCPYCRTTINNNNNKYQTLE